MFNVAIGLDEWPVATHRPLSRTYLRHIYQLFFLVIFASGGTFSHLLSLHRHALLRKPITHKKLYLSLYFAH